MASSSIIPSGWLLAHGLHDLGIAFFAHVQKKSRSSGHDSSGTQSLQLRPANAAIHNDNKDDSGPPTSADPVQSTIEAARVSMQKALDCQTFIVSLFTRDVTQLCHHLRLLEAPLTRDVDAMIVAAGKDDDARLVRDFKSRLDSVELAYEPLIKRMITAAAGNTSTFPDIALRDAAKAEMHANALYSWARTHVPMDTNTLTKTDKAAKLKLIPYIVAMAYAVRVKLDVHFVESSGVDKAERLEYLERSRTVVEQFMEILRVAVFVTIHETSLLEVAMDYSVALTTYVTLIKAMQATGQMAFKPKDELKAITQWDDGLSGIRAIFQIKNDDANPTSSATIVLNYVEEVIKWAQFVGHDLRTMEFKDLTDTVHHRELLFVLGADLDDTSMASIRFAPDYKRALLDLSPADGLRSSLQAKLATAVNVPQSHQTIQSFATIRNAVQLAAAAATLKTPANATIPNSPQSSPPPAVAPSIPLSPRFVYTLTGHSSDVSGVAVTCDGQRAVSASYDKTARVWDLSTGRAMQTFNGHSDEVNCAAIFSDNTHAVTGSDDKTLRIWNINTGKHIRAFSGHKSFVLGVAISPDECTLASSSRDNTVKLWRAHSGKCIATLRGHGNWVRCVAWSADGQTLASGSADGALKVWSVHSHSLLSTINHAHSSIVTGVAFAGDVMVSCSADKTIRVRDWQSGTLLTTLSGHTQAVNCVAVFDDNERVASGSADHTVRIWNLRSGLCEHTLTGHTSFVYSVAVSRDGRTLVSGSYDESIKVWTLRD